jgi:antitoxin component YwqK of YwqJK toxin-antitoxin module
MKKCASSPLLRVILGLCFAVISLTVYAQCKTFSLSDRGDTLNCVDFKGMRQGPWLQKFPELRGNPGYEEEGVYKNDKKEGVWRKYSEQGDVLAVESYKWGLLHGKCSYYSLLGLEREEGWWAIDPGKLYDTIDVPDLFTDGVYHKVVIKNEGHSLKQGTWRTFDPMTGRITSTQEYIRDSAVGVLGSMGVKTKQPVNGNNTGDTTKKKVEKPSIVSEWEEKNKGKKKVKVRDGSIGY